VEHDKVCRRCSVVLNIAVELLESLLCFPDAPRLASDDLHLDDVVLAQKVYEDIDEPVAIAEFRADECQAFRPTFEVGGETLLCDPLRFRLVLNSFFGPKGFPVAPLEVLRERMKRREEIAWLVEALDFLK